MGVTTSLELSFYHIGWVLPPNPKAAARSNDVEYICELCAMKRMPFPDLISQGKGLSRKIKLRLPHYLQLQLGRSSALRA